MAEIPENPDPNNPNNPNNPNIDANEEFCEDLIVIVLLLTESLQAVLYLALHLLLLLESSATSFLSTSNNSHLDAHRSGGALALPFLDDSPAENGSSLMN